MIQCCSSHQGLPQQWDEEVCWITWNLGLETDHTGRWKKNGWRPGILLSYGLYIKAGVQLQETVVWVPQAQDRGYVRHFQNKNRTRRNESFSTIMTAVTQHRAVADSWTRQWCNFSVCKTWGDRKTNERLLCRLGSGILNNNIHSLKVI